MPDAGERLHYEMAASLQRTLYRELLRAGRRIEACTRPGNAARVSARLDNFVDGSMKGEDSPRQRVRTAFRSPSGPESIDRAFAALRGAHQTMEWLEPNSKLHALAASAAPTEDGAVVIAETLAEPGTAAMNRTEVQAELDRIADVARGLMEASPQPLSRLHKLALVNRAIFESEGFSGEFHPVRVNSSIGSMLSRRRGLPILLCTLYQSVAARAGVPLEFTNFPQRILLRLEPELAEGELGGGEEHVMAEALTRLRLAELKEKLQERGLPTNGRKAILVERLAKSLADEEAAETAAAAAEAAGAVAAASSGSAASAGESISAQSLCGLWIADYGPHGPEVVEVSLEQQQQQDGAEDGGGGGAPGAPGTTLRAIKLTGDPHVPAGELTWRAQLTAAVAAAAATEPPRVAVGAKLPAQMRVAEEGLANARLVPGELLVAGETQLLLGMGGDVGGGGGESGESGEGGDGKAGGAADDAGEGGERKSRESRGARETMAFSRAPQSALWFVDPWCRGALLPPPYCFAALRQLGLGDAPDTRSEWTGSIRPARVWARMLRNLQSREEPGSPEALFWEDVAFGLEGAGRNPQSVIRWDRA